MNMISSTKSNNIKILSTLIALTIWLVTFFVNNRIIYIPIANKKDDSGDYTGMVYQGIYCHEFVSQLLVVERADKRQSIGETKDTGLFYYRFV